MFELSPLADASVVFLATALGCGVFVKICIPLYKIRFAKRLMARAQKDEKLEAKKVCKGLLWGIKQDILNIHKTNPSTKKLRFTGFRSEGGNDHIYDFTTKENTRLFGGYEDDSLVERYSVEYQLGLLHRVTRYKVPSFIEVIKSTLWIYDDNKGGYVKEGDNIECE